MAPHTASSQLANIILDGELATFLTERRAGGDSWEQISKKLYVLDPRIDVSGQTVQSWFERLDERIAAS